MRQISGWLEQFGVGQDCSAFLRRKRCEIGIPVDLTDQGLEQIGVSSFGHRRKLLRAIAEFNDARGGAHRFSRRDRIDANGVIKCRSLA